ncbi:uncharacterized protein LOC127801854 isoform X2 [Diospyros lotus]|uniref:uncharacterized protein LOC127801854 isoform X2 n=1 Tax=Diospyros lotus TaxID=55363 RepID=UPI002259ED06|nr:uncharacterized protein LOC127801854 isoform X2 [Diospyros lotus]
MANHRMDAEEEALFRAYPQALYFVQSPSTVSHANSSDLRNIAANDSSAFHSPHNPAAAAAAASGGQDASRLELSRYSSSRGSNNSFYHCKKLSYDLQSQGTGAGTDNGENGRLVGRVSNEEDDYEDEEEGGLYFGRKGEGGWQRYFSFRRSSSLAWICLQLLWRLLASLVVAVLVFYIATKPPPPKVSITVARIRPFRLGEGVDGSGVTTKILTCNCSIDLLIDNKSKLFALRLQPPLIQLAFATLPLAISYGPKLYAESDGPTSFQLSVATTNKPMYGAGRAMQDMLDMKGGLPLGLRVSLRSSFRVVWGLIKLEFHHTADCLLVLQKAYDKKRRSQAYNSSCVITST